MTENELLHVVGLYMADVATGDLINTANKFLHNVCARPPKDGETHIIPALQQPDETMYNHGGAVTIDHIKQYVDGHMLQDEALLFMERVIDFGQTMMLLDHCISLNLDLSNAPSFQTQMQLLMSPQRKAAAHFLVMHRTEIEERDAMLSMVERIGSALGHIMEGNDDEDGEEASLETPSPTKVEIVNYVPGNKLRH